MNEAVCKKRQQCFDTYADLARGYDLYAEMHSARTRG